MRDNSENFEIEKTIANAMRNGASRPAPSFDHIAGKIAAGEPRESFEEFFAGELLPSRSSSALGNKKITWKWLAGAAAAALVFIVGGGVALGAFLGGSLKSADAAASTANESRYYDRLDDSDKQCLEDAAAEQYDCAEKNVSDSDWDDSVSEESSES